MAATSLAPLNGAVTVTGKVYDYNNFTIESDQMVDDVTPYGANVMAKHVGNGTPSLSVTIGAFCLKGATGTPAGLCSAPATGGVSTTLTLDTGVTEAGLLVIAKIRVEHGRMRAAVPISLSGSQAGDWTETWPTT